MSDGRITLEERLKEGPLSPDEAVRIVWALCDRFEKQGKAETLGDVSPQRVTMYGRQIEAMVPDAMPIRGYSAPERVSSGPTPRSDVYAMGSLLVHLLTGKPYDGSALPNNALHLQPVLEKCLQRDPTARFANLSELKRALVRMDKTLVSGPKLVADKSFARTSLGPWNLEGILGQGSMGTVYRAKHQALGRLAAVKVLRAEQYQNPELVHRFFQEARTVNQINHEHIVEISDFVQEPGPKGPEVVYCVMELLQGRTLGDELDAAPMRLERGLRIIEQLADALAAAHRVGVVHRDVKPDNIMLIERGGSKDYVKVLDFGVAKLTHTDGKAMVSTTEGAIIGTPICMSPEQAQGDDIDARSDVWAVGVILYRLLTGVFPFDAATFVNIAVQIITKPYAPLPQKTGAGEVVPERLARLVEKCLQKRRDLRPASMDEVRDELRAILQNDGARAPKRSVLPLAVAVVAVLGVVAGGAFWKVSGADPKPPPPVVVPPPLVLPPPVVLEVDASVAPDEVDAGATEVDAGVAQVEPVDAGTSKPKPVVRKAVPLSVDLLLSELKDLRPKLNGCGTKYASERALVVGKEAKLHFEIQKSGRLTNVSLAPPVQGGALEKCVAGVLAQNPFPPNDGNPKFSKPTLGVRFSE